MSTTSTPTPQTTTTVSDPVMVNATPPSSAAEAAAQSQYGVGASVQALLLPQIQTLEAVLTSVTNIATAVEAELDALRNKFIS